MKKVLFVLMFAAVAFVGCSKQQEEIPAAPEAPVAAENAPAPSNDNGQAPAAPAAPEAPAQAQ